MQLEFVAPLDSIRMAVTSDLVAEFVVLTGPNGAGKSNLLQAIAQRKITVAGVDGPTPQDPSPIRIFRLSELVTQAEGAQSPANYRERYVQLHIQVQNLTAQYSSPQQGNYTGEKLDDVVCQQLVAQGQISDSALREAIAKAGKPITSFLLPDFRRFAPILIGIRDPFTMSVTEVFLAYHERRNHNERDQWLVSEKGRFDLTPLSDPEFLTRYGIPPWELLDEAMLSIDLPYRFVPPQGTEEDLLYEARLVNKADGAEIRVDQLSTGERTLLAIAMSLFSGVSMTQYIRMPRILLLDEVDASLHPSMVGSLLRVIRDVFVDRHSMKVIMTTHSPTTVALAPEESLYVMRRTAEPRLIKASRDEALSSLTVGLPTLSVRIENRRQVFVESEYDEDCYQRLFALTRERLQTPYSLSFVASGKGGGGSCDAVIALVGALRDSGNDSIWGIVDRDARTSSPAWVLFNPSRYAIENVVLDPLGVAILLLRNGAVKAEQAGLAPGLRHFEIAESDIQPLVDYVSSCVASDGDDLTPVQVHYLDGATSIVPKYWTDTQGHALEDRLRSSFPALRAEKSHLMRAVIQNAYRDIPEFIPREILDLFAQLVA